jgi:putative nucleotidyltransferase with HDIG domain
MGEGGERTPGTAGAREVLATAPGAVAGEIRVLLIDGHPLVLRFMGFAFASNGCVVHSAGNGEDALSLLRTEPVDLVVADVAVPGLAGPELLQAAAEHQPGVPVVLTSTAAAEPAATALREQGHDYLKQPFSAEDVEKLVQKVADQRRQREAESQAVAGPSGTLGGLEGLYRIADTALRGSDTTTFLAEALEHTLAALGGDAACLLLRDEEGHPTVSQTGDRALAGHLLGVLEKSLETLFASTDGATVPVIDEARGLVGVAAPVPAPGKVTGILCLARHGAGATLDEAKAYLSAYARTIGVSLQKVVLTESLEDNVIDTISSFVVALEAKDVYLKGHSARVSLYVGEVARVMGMPSNQAAMARRAGILHDLGKLVIRDSIYRTPSALSDESSALMREHPANGANILKPLRFLVEEAEAIRRHHEHYDGGGYPDGLKGDAIPLAARLVAVADAFDDMTSSRPYRTPMAIEAAVQEILRHAGTQFDPAVAEAFARIPRRRLEEIAGFYVNRAEPPAERQSALELMAASKRLFARKGWSAGHAAEPGRRKGSRAGGPTPTPPPRSAVSRPALG